MKKYVLFLICLLSVIQLEASSPQQDSKAEKKWPAWLNFRNGLQIVTPDSLFSMSFRFRIQNRLGYLSRSASDFRAEELDFRVRRARLRLDGWVYRPEFTYQLQLSFSRADMDWDVSNLPNVLRDALIGYQHRSGFAIQIGQGKLPGNRQRVISSGELQFCDRSVVNNYLTLDRDFGVFFQYRYPGFKRPLILKAALSSGEGRNQLRTDKGLAYTIRLEWLPLGPFSGKNDYIEGDLERESKPKVSLGSTAHFNHRAQRTGGQLGKQLYEPKDLLSAEADFVVKYRGWALSSEYLYRKSLQDPRTIDQAGDLRYVFTGHGLNTQLSYCFRKMWEIAARHSLLIPDAALYGLEPRQQHYGLGLSKYFWKHKLKIQTDWFYLQEMEWKRQSETGRFQWRFQVEIGI